MLTLNTHRLEIFREVAARGTIAAAAKALHLTAPAVSHQIGKLERELRVSLLDRTPRSVRLTEAGHLLVRRAETILAECEAAVAEIAAHNGDISGLVRVSLSEVEYEFHVLTAMRVQERHPALEVVLVSMPPLEALGELRAGSLDIMLSMEWEGRRATAIAGTTRHDLLTDSYEVVLPPGHPLSTLDRPLRLSDLARERWCLPREQRFRELLEQTMRAAGFEPWTVFEGTNAFGIATTVGMGFGVGIIPRGMEAILGDVAIKPLDEPDLTRHVFALVRAGSERSPAIGTVLGVMDEGAAEAVARGVGSLPVASGARV